MKTRVAKHSQRRRTRARAAAPAAATGNGNGAGHEPFVVGIGASAGGLQALQAFFGAIKEPPHAAFVVVQHLSPDFKSFMVELLAKHTTMPVQRAEHNVQVKPGNIYLIPPRMTLTISKGRLRLEKFDPQRGLHLPIDQFFFSLAEDQQHRAIGVVLSGTGSDGTAGIRAVKDAGGMVMVQSEDSAQFDGMPRSAIGTGLADFVLPPENMPAQLASYLSHPLLTNKRVFDPRRDGDANAMLGDIFTLLRTQCGVDFSNYKPATVDRRIERRMSVCQIDTLADYARHLAQSSREVSLLFNELLIGVTSFFRDRAAWEALEKEVLPELLKEVPAGDTFRAWVAGCSTGEEAYTLAMVVAEVMDKLKLRNAVKIFATDISKEALAIAARGHYSPSEVAGLPPARLNKFFVKESSTYRVTTRLREMVVFANHNLLGDPPFTKLSLVSCRNLLIYLQAPLQQRLLTLFSFALNEEGVLFLGGSESIGDATDRFRPLAARANIYRNRRGPNPPAVVMHSGTSRLGRLTAGKSPALQRAVANMSVGDAPSLDEIHKRVLAEFTPACLVVDSRDDLIHVVGAGGDYLKQPPGPFTRNVFKLTSHNLANALRSALIRAQQKGDRFTYEDVRYRDGRKLVAVNLHVRPLPDKNGKLTGVRLVFIEKKPVPGAATKTRADRAEKHHTQQIADLERDLSLTRESLQATVQDLETSNEEIQAANEELLAANEELQSTNEELQSVNEELHTVNIENQNRIEELTRLTNDINNLLGAAALGVLLIDAQLRVRRASRSALALLELNDTDLGVPIETVARILHAHDLPAMAERVMRTGQAEEREIERAIVRRWLLLRCMPFHNEVGKPDGVVLSIVDLTERHVAEQRLIAQAALTQSVLDAMEAHVAILDCDGCIIHVNEKWMTFAAAVGVQDPERLAVGANYFDVCDSLHESATPGATGCLDGLRQVLRGERPNYSCDYGTKHTAERRWFRLHAVPLNRSAQPGLAVAHFEITPIKQAEELLAHRLAGAGAS